MHFLFKLKARKYRNSCLILWKILHMIPNMVVVDNDNNLVESSPEKQSSDHTADRYCCWYTNLCYVSTSTTFFPTRTFLLFHTSIVARLHEIGLIREHILFPRSLTDFPSWSKGLNISPTLRERLWKKMTSRRLLGYHDNKRRGAVRGIISRGVLLWR